jgi:hypothetical protein
MLEEELRLVTTHARQQDERREIAQSEERNLKRKVQMIERTLEGLAVEIDKVKLIHAAPHK